MEAAGCQQNPVTVPRPPGLSYGQKSHFWQITGGRSCLLQEGEAVCVLKHRRCPSQRLVPQWHKVVFSAFLTLCCSQLLWVVRPGADHQAG